MKNIWKKITESSKKQNLGLPFTSNYLYCFRYYKSRDVLKYTGGVHRSYENITPFYIKDFSIGRFWCLWGWGVTWNQSPSDTGCQEMTLWLCAFWYHYEIVSCAVLSCSVVSNSATPWTVRLQASLSVGILQARILEWVAMPSTRGFSQYRDWT